MACCTNDTQSGGTSTSSYIAKTIATAQIIHTGMHYYYDSMNAQIALNCLLIIGISKLLQAGQIVHMHACT